MVTLPLCRWFLLMVGKTFSANSSGMFTRTVSPLLSEFITRTCSQRSLVDPDWPSAAEAPASTAMTDKRLRPAKSFVRLNIELMPPRHCLYIRGVPGKCFRSRFYLPRRSLEFETRPGSQVRSGFRGDFRRPLQEQRAQRRHGQGERIGATHMGSGLRR